MRSKRDNPSAADLRMFRRLTAYFGGERRALHFLDAFSGTQFKGPTRETIEWLAAAAEDRRAADPRTRITFQILSEHFEDERLAIDFTRAFAGEAMDMPTMRVVQTLVPERAIVRALELQASDW